MTNGVLRRRKKIEAPPPTDDVFWKKPLYRPKALEDSSNGSVEALLLKTDLTDQEIDDYLWGESTTLTHNNNNNPLTPQQEAFYKRRKEIQELAAKVESGGAHIDADYRLVPTPPTTTPQQPLPPLNNNNNNNQGPGRPENNNNAMENEDAERRWVEREQREAAEAIARAVQRYRDQGVPEEEFELIPIPPRQQDNVNLTFRRICFAVLAVVTAFVCIMLQTLPLLHTVSVSNAIFDPLLYEILHVRKFSTHLRHCNGLQRRGGDALRDVALGQEGPLDCSDGVLHIPSTRVLMDAFLRATTVERATLLEPYVYGVNASWWMPCERPPAADTCSSSSSHQGSSMGDLPCFRGVHDGWVQGKQVDDTLELGAALIKSGGDHFDIYDDVSILSDRVPTLVETVRQLLHREYQVANMEPVAFRVSIALPMDAADVPGEKSSKLLSRNINSSNYVRWMEETKAQNSEAAYAIGPFGTRVIRDTCNLMGDLEADPRFHVHTLVFLSHGAGWDYQGGVALYADSHRSNANPRKKIRRGITVDGSRGRIVVSTGGLENRRCRMPTRAGIRAALQIWWSYY